MVETKFIDISSNKNESKPEEIPPYSKQRTEWIFPVPLWGFGLPTTLASRRTSLSLTMNSNVNY